MINRPVKLIGSILTPPWSSDRLSRLYKRFAGSGNIGEVWETSVIPESPARLSGGVTEFFSYLRESKIGLPPLVKLLSAKTPLSVQVHPDEHTAAKHGGTAKTEIWYVLDADDGASILYGTKAGVTRRDIAHAISEKNVVPLLNTRPVRAGDVIMIPPGMIHSLGGGITVLEVQNTAGTTYRLQDLSGDRETHPVEAMDSVHLYTPEEAASLALTTDTRLIGAPLPGRLIASTEEFAVSVCEDSSASIPDGGVYMFCAVGGGTASDVSFEAGESLFFPAGTDSLSFRDGSQVIFVR